MLKDAGLTHTRLLPAHIINMRFQRHAPDGLQNQCRSAVEAWMLIRRYGIDLDSPQMQLSSNAYFIDWCNRAAPKPSSAEIVEADLPALLCDHIDELLPFIDAPPLLIDIEHLAPNETRFFETLDERLKSGVALYTNQTWHSKFDADLGPTTTPKIGRAGAKKRCIAATNHRSRNSWQPPNGVVMFYKTAPGAHIGVVVPNLDAQYDRVLRQFSAALSPDSGSSAPIFDISGGNSLVSQPVWRHACILLDWMRASPRIKPPLLRCSIRLFSPYLGAAI